MAPVFSSLGIKHPLGLVEVPGISQEARSGVSSPASGLLSSTLLSPYTLPTLCLQESEGSV